MIGTLLLAAALLPAPDSETELLKSDIAFAEDLARYQYFELAQQVVGDLAQAVGDDAETELRGDLAFARARILKAEAERHLDPERRASARDAAIQAYTDFTKEPTPFAFHPRLLDALEDLAVLLRARADERARAARAGDAESALAAAEDYDAADDAYERLQEEAEALADQQESNGLVDVAQLTRERANLTLYLRGLNGIDWARVSDDPTFRLQEAIEDLDAYLWEVDETQLLYLMATFELGRAYAILSRYTPDPEDAQEYLNDALDILTTGVLDEYNLEGYWEPINDFGPAGRVAIAALFDRAWAFMAELEAERGDLEAAQGWIDTMRAEHARKDVPFGPEGLRALIDWADRLVELGRTDAATDILKFVAGPDGGSGTPEGADAQVALARLVENQGVGAITSVDVLVSVGKGLLKEQEHAEAGYAFLRAHALMETDEQRAQYKRETLDGAQRALTLQGRHLEAAMVLEELLTFVRAQDPPDLPQVERVAGNLISAYERQAKASGDAFDKELRREAQERLDKIPGISLDVQWIRANELLTEAAQSEEPAAYMAALAELEAVPESSPNYENALVAQGKALAGARRYEEALERFERMLERAADPDRQPTNQAAIARREGALAQARYEAARLLLSEPLQRPEEALEKLADFEEDLPGQPNFHAPVKQMRVEAFAMAGRLDDAEDALDALRASAASATRVQVAALATYGALVEAAQAHPEGHRERRALMGRAAAALGVANEADRWGSFANGLLQAQHHLEADEPAEAERVARKVLDATEGKQVPTANRDLLLKTLAMALDEQQDYGRARPIWKDLEARNPNRIDILRGAARSFGGWLEVDDDGNVVEIAGAGDYDEAHQLWNRIYPVVNARNKYEPIWWETKLGGIYTLYRQIPQDSSLARDARALLTNVQIFTPQYDADVQDQLPEDKRFEPRFRPLFRYLDRQIPNR